ncbi:MAG: hypothetical protein IGR92_04740 [Leptolyngbyaceae cyanobacterium T60_A2020_046]|nr:hypothetical protein [Leptolyngbyaceae cyanobacterium T60_A2020_046]
MWQTAINLFRSLWTYRELSPDLGLRRRVNLRLRSRPRLGFEEWAGTFNLPPSGHNQRLLRFIYTQLQRGAGLDVGRIRPSDRLIDDLHLPLVCWFDWPSQLCDAFFTTFQRDILEEFDESLLDTVGDLAWFLNQKLQSMDSLSSA